MNSAKSEEKRPLSPAEERKKRLAEALRKNLRLRKARERASDAQPAGNSDASGNGDVESD